MTNPLSRVLSCGLLFACLFCGSTHLLAQDDAEERPEGWERGAALGADLGQLLQFNPRVGSGEDRIGIGTNFTAFARLKRGLERWDNNVSLNFAVQKLGQGVLPPGFNANEKVPYQKSIDEIRLASQYGREFGEEVPWGYGVEATFISQITATFQDSAGRNILKDIDGNNASGPIAKFLSPATFTLSPGFTYRPDDHFDMLVSPASYKTIFIADESIANVTSPNGTRLYQFIDPDNAGNTSLQQFGASVRANYANNFLKDDRLVVKSTLGLFSNYLLNPQNVDLDWRNELGIQIVDGLTVTLNTVVLYDDDVPVQISNFDLVGGVERNEDGSARLGRRVSVTEQILIKYGIVF